MWRKWNPAALLVGMQPGADTVENSMWWTKPKGVGLRVGGGDGFGRGLRQGENGDSST